MGEGGAIVPVLPVEEQDSVLQRSAQQTGTLTRDVAEWTCEDVASWICNIVGLPLYRQIFLDNHISGAILLKLDRENLKELLPSIGHRVLLLESLSKLVANFEHRLGAPVTSQYVCQVQGWQAVEVKGPIDNMAVTCALGSTQSGHLRLEGHQPEGGQPNMGHDPHSGIQSRRNRQKQAYRHRGLDIEVSDSQHTLLQSTRLDSDESELLENQPMKMSFIDRIRYVHNEFMRMKTQDLKADRMWRREVCKKIGLRIEETKLADSLRWHDNLFQIAFREGEIWELQDKIFSKWERWEIKGQKEAYQEHTGTKRRRRSDQPHLLRNPECDPPPGMPLLPWRALQGISNKETMKSLLQQVVDCQLSMKEMEEKGSTIKSLERMRAAFVDLSQSANWQHCAERFPPFTTDLQLSALLKDFQKKRSNEERRNKPAIPDSFVQHVHNAMVWEEHTGRLRERQSIAGGRVGDAHHLTVLQQSVAQAHLQNHHRLAAELRQNEDGGGGGVSEGYVSCSEVHLEDTGVLGDKCGGPDGEGQFENPSSYKPVLGASSCLVPDDGGLNLP